MKEKDESADAKKIYIYPARSTMFYALIAFAALMLQFYLFGLYELCFLIFLVGGILLPLSFLSSSFIIHLSDHSLAVEPRLRKSILKSHELSNVAHESSLVFKYEKDDFISTCWSFLELETLITLIVYPFVEKQSFVIYHEDKEILRVGANAIGLEELTSQMSRYRKIDHQ